MSQPIPYLPGDTRHDIRNTNCGEFLFAPTKLMRQAFMFVLASAARRYNVGIVAYAMMCTHVHVLVVDLGPPGGASSIPDFRRFLRSTFGQFVNWYWDRGGSIFCKNSTGNSIKVLDFESVDDAIVYIETNAVNAGMEKSPELMKGAVSQREWILDPVTVERPPVYFRKQKWEDEESLQLVVPPEAAARGFDPESYYEHTSETLNVELKRIRKHRKRRGLKARPLHVLERLRPEHGSGRSSANHSEVLFACKNPFLSAREFKMVRAFRRRHRLALAALRAGLDDDVVFPAGTYLAAKRYGVKVAPPVVFTE